MIYIEAPIVMSFNQEPTLSFQGRDKNEAELFCRFLKLKRDIVPLREQSLGIRMTFPKAYKHLAEDLKVFAEEFGVNLQKRGRDGLIKHTFRSYSVKLSKLESRDIKLKFSKNSLVWKGIESSREIKDLRSSDTVESIHYRLRPWITDSFKLCDFVEGNISAVRDGRKIDIQFGYCESAD